MFPMSKRCRNTFCSGTLVLKGALMSLRLTPLARPLSCMMTSGPMGLTLPPRCCCHA